MRKNELRRLANSQLMSDNRGSHRDKQYRRFVIHKVMHDLFKLGKIPSKWHGLNQEHVRALVFYWKKSKVNPTTLMKYMTVLRYFLKSIDHYINGIDNQSLGIVRTKSKTKKSPTPDVIFQIADPLAKLLVQVQSNFGLTFSEAIRIIPGIHIREHDIWLTRDIAFNHQDRVISIRHDDQLTLLQSFSSHTTNQQSLIGSLGYHAVLHLYRIALQNAGLSSLKSYRYLYAKQQHAYLLQAFSTQKANEILMREMGLKSRSTLWGYLHE